jgi:hypothetical protein
VVLALTVLAVLAVLAVLTALVVLAAVVAFALAFPHRGQVHRVGHLNADIDLGTAVLHNY